MIQKSPGSNKPVQYNFKQFGLLYNGGPNFVSRNRMI